jgi:hypothetical protein
MTASSLGVTQSSLDRFLEIDCTSQNAANIPMVRTTPLCDGFATVHVQFDRTTNKGYVQSGGEPDIQCEFKTW